MAKLIKKMTIDGEVFISADSVMEAMLAVSVFACDIDDNRIGEYEADHIEAYLDLFDELELPDFKRAYKIRWFNRRFIKSKKE